MVCAPFTQARITPGLSAANILVTAGTEGVLEDETVAASTTATTEDASGTAITAAVDGSAVGPTARADSAGATKEVAAGDSPDDPAVVDSAVTIRRLCSPNQRLTPITMTFTMTSAGPNPAVIISSLNLLFFQTSSLLRHQARAIRQIPRTVHTVAESHSHSRSRRHPSNRPRRRCRPNNSKRPRRRQSIVGLRPRLSLRLRRRRIRLRVRAQHFQRTGQPAGTTSRSSRILLVVRPASPRQRANRSRLQPRLETRREIRPGLD